MTDKELDKAFEIRAQLMNDIVALVNDRLFDEPDIISEKVKEGLQENMRYW